MSLNKILRLQTMAVDENTEMRRRAAKHIMLPKRLMLLLADDREDGVVETLFENPNLDEDVRIRIAQRLGKEYKPVKYKAIGSCKAINTNLSVDKLIENTRFLKVSAIVDTRRAVILAEANECELVREANRNMVAERGDLSLDTLLKNTKSINLKNIQAEYKTTTKYEFEPIVIKSEVCLDLGVEKIRNVDRLVNSSVPTNLRGVVKYEKYKQLEIQSKKQEQLVLAPSGDYKKQKNVDRLIENTSDIKIKMIVEKQRVKSVDFSVEVVKSIDAFLLKDQLVASAMSRLLRGKKINTIGMILDSVHEKKIEVVARIDVAQEEMDKIVSSIKMSGDEIAKNIMAGFKPSIKSASFYLKRFT